MDGMTVQTSVLAVGSAMTKHTQQDIIDYMEDPETIRRAAEGSMEKRQSLLDRHTQREELERKVADVCDRTRAGLLPTVAFTKIMQLVDSYTSTLVSEAEKRAVQVFGEKVLDCTEKADRRRVNKQLRRLEVFEDDVVPVSVITSLMDLQSKEEQKQ